MFVSISRVYGCILCLWSLFTLWLNLYPFYHNYQNFKECESYLQQTWHMCHGAGLRWAPLCQSIWMLCFRSSSYDTFQNPGKGLIDRICVVKMQSRSCWRCSRTWNKSNQPWHVLTHSPRCCTTSGRCW